MNEIKEIKGVTVLGVELDFYCIVPKGSTHLGLVTLECDGRSFVWDTVQTRTYEDFDHTRIEVDLDSDVVIEEDLAPDCKFDLMAVDFHDPNLKGRIWFEESVETSNGEWVEPDSQELAVRLNNEDGSGMTMIIDLEIE